MGELQFLSKTEQVAAFLSDQLFAGRWVGLMPGRFELSAELGLSARTVEDALQQLERSGVLVAQGAGRRRRIELQQSVKPKVLKIGVMMYESQDLSLPYHVDLIHRLENAGHEVGIAPRTLSEMAMDIYRVEREVEELKADAWIVEGGSHAMLDWFSKRGVPVMAVFGRFSGLPVAGTGVHKIPALQKAVRKLFELGHRRVVMLAREERRKPYPAPQEQAFLDELETLGIETGIYHMPDWENNSAGFHRCIDSLFQHTPPTALFVSEARIFVALQQHLAHLGLIAPRDVSLVCGDPDIAFSWCDPPVSHIRWDSRPIVSRIIRWADRVARGEVDESQRYTLAKFMPGGTIGPVAT